MDPLIGQPRITVAMPARDEAGRYLREWLDQWRPVARMIVVDDGSTDDTAELAGAAGARVVPASHLGARCTFAEEWRLRSAVWRLAVMSGADWIALVDADELFDPPPAEWLAPVLGALPPECRWLGFPLYDLWGDRGSYRDDALWTAHRRTWPLIARNTRRFTTLAARNLHCGRFPADAIPPDSPGGVTAAVHVLHLGWVTEPDRRRKYDRYMASDPDGALGSLAQYRSILDASPHLVPLPGPG